MSPNNVSRKEKILLGTVHNLKDKVSALSLENAELRAHIHVLKSELQDSQHQTEEFRSIVEGSVEGVVHNESENSK